MLMRMKFNYLIRMVLFTEMTHRIDPAMADKGMVLICDYADFDKELMTFWSDSKFNKLHMKITFNALPLKIGKMFIEKNFMMRKISTAVF